jgi:hypothetical protein
MHSRILVAGIALVAASISAAHAQKADFPTTTKAPAGLAFSYDPQHGGLSANGSSAQPRPDVTTPAALFTGRVTVDLTIQIPEEYPPETQFRCSALVFVGDLEYLEGGILTANGTAISPPSGSIASSSSANCLLTLPYKMSLNAIPEGEGSLGLFIVYAASANAPDGTVIRSFVQIAGSKPMPSSEDGILNLMVQGQL